jgi:Zn-dependent protease with chaperone function
VLYGLAALVTGDNSALRVLHCRYGHVGGATEFFTALRGKHGSGFPGSHYVASHPAMDARIAALHAAMVSNGMQQGPVRAFAVAQ